MLHERRISHRRREGYRIYDDTELTVLDLQRTFEPQSIALAVATQYALQREGHDGRQKTACCLDSTV
jgi:DNA-binding transcriptional MerR regulator